MLETLQPWEALLKRIVWLQLDEIKGKKILDFGSGIGVTANHYARNNEVIAIEPSVESVNERWSENEYIQIMGSIEDLRKLEDESFDITEINFLPRDFWWTRSKGGNLLLAMAGCEIFWYNCQREQKHIYVDYTLIGMCLFNKLKPHESQARI